LKIESGVEEPAVLLCYDARHWNSLPGGLSMVRAAVVLSARDAFRLSQLFRYGQTGLLALAAALLFIPGTILAQEKNPFAGDPKAAKLGESQFRINCAFCHGLGARGGGRGPDLTRAQKKHGSKDEDLYHTINEGVPGTAMPANGTTGQGVGMTAEEIWEVITYIRSVEKKAIPAGDVAKGDALFHGAPGCATCHMMNGKGGRLGPDLSSIGAARSTDSLVESVRSPSRRLAWGLIESTKEFPQEYLSVNVETADGRKFSGVVLNEDNFSLQMMDMREQIHVFEKDKLKSCDISRESRMPTYDSKALSDSELQDIVAYLVSVSAK
jgi:cytochrome c oxidase cbb3-type subunit 3